jgi:uncharacterized protein (TIGR02466 family)
MKWNDPFCISILGNILSDITPHDISLYKDLVISSPVYENKGGYFTTLEQNFLNDPLFSKLLKNIYHTSKEYLKEVGHKFEDIQISNSWAVISNKNNESPHHNHVNAYLSGVYYLTDGSPIEFLNPVDKLWNFYPEFNEEADDFRSYRTFQLDPIPNLLLIFPSYLPHKILPSTKDTSRISIAFNIIPKGEFGVDAAKLYL